MKHYIIYDSQTLAVRWMEARQDDLLPEPPEGCAVAPVPDAQGVRVDNFWIAPDKTVRTRSDPPSRFHKWVDGAWVESTAERLSAESERARNKRDRALAESDWTDTASAPARLGEKYDDWQSYRQALRDVTDQPGFPLDVVWPTPPE